MKSFKSFLTAFISLVLFSVCVGDQYVFYLRDSLAFCSKESNIDPNAHAKTGDIVRLNYNCNPAYDVNYITIEYEDTPFDGCFVKILENNNSLCYTTSPFHHGKGMTIKAEPCYDFPGQQLWNFENIGDNDFKIHPAGRLDLCLTSVRPWRSHATTPLSIQPCYVGNDKGIVGDRDMWASACGWGSFANFTCSSIDPSVNCGGENGGN